MAFILGVCSLERSRERLFCEAGASSMDEKGIILLFHFGGDLGDQKETTVFAMDLESLNSGLE